MNHLGLDSSMRVIFDAGDARLEDGGIEAGDGTDEDQVDLSQLRGASGVIRLTMLHELTGAQPHSYPTSR